MMKQLTYLALLSFSSFGVFSCLESDSKDNNAIVENEVSIPFMVHAGSNPVTCGTEMTELGTENNSGYMTNFRLYVHDAELVDESGKTYPITLDKSDWQTANVTLLSFTNKENCLDGTGDDVVTNMEIKGKYEAPKKAVITGLNFKVGVPENLNRQFGDEISEGPLSSSVSGMFWGWATGYIFMQVHAQINEEEFLFHLGSSACTGNAVEGNVSCARENRPEITLSNFDLTMSAVEIDFQALVSNLDLSAANACHSGTMPMQVTTCKNVFDALGLDYFTAEGETIPQENEGQIVFKSAMNHH